MSHVIEHEANGFLPADFLQSDEFQNNPNRREIFEFHKKEGSRACYEFFHLILHMGEKGLNFPPVKIVFDREIYHHLDSDFLRSIAMFDSCINYDWNIFLGKSRTFKYVLDRIMRLGNSGEAQALRYHEPVSLDFRGYEDVIVKTPKAIEEFIEE